MENERSFGRRERGRFLVGQGTQHPGSGDVRDLIAVDESQSVFGLDGNTIEDIELWDLQDVLDRSELRIHGTEDWRTHREPSVRGWLSVVHWPLLLLQISSLHFTIEVWLGTALAAHRYASRHTLRYELYDSIERSPERRVRSTPTEHRTLNVRRNDPFDRRH
jgi:hypothetical protein